MLIFKMKYAGKLFMFFLFLLCVLLLGEIIPYKKAIGLKDIREENGYKVLKITEAQTTSPLWRVIGTEKGLFDNSQPFPVINPYVVLTGNFPEKNVVKNLLGASEATNKYVLYCLDYGVVDSKLDRDKFEVFWVYKWDILYPIDRGASLFPWLRSKKHLSIYDFH